MTTSTATNVVRLPTAARRQVRQHGNKAAREARAALREKCPWPGEFMYPGIREGLRKAAVLGSVDQTPALLIASAIFAILDTDTKKRVVEHLALGAAAGRTAHVQAVTALNVMRATFGEQNDLDFAFRHLGWGARP